MKLVLPLLCLTVATAVPLQARQGVARPVLSASPETSPAPAAAQVPAVPAASPALVPDTSRYLIGLDDTLQITVWKEPSLSGSIPVRPDGMISLALLGDVPASGMTPMALGSDIASRLRKFLTDPNVTVTVVGVHPKQIFLIGEVGHVGALPLTPEMTPLQAISSAGGLGPFADAKHIYILRGEAGKQKKIPFNYKIALKTGNQQGVSLVSGDTIVIP